MSHTDEPAGPLAGLAGWIIRDGKAGHESQSRGVAAALGLACEEKLVAPRGPWKLMAPWGRPDPRERFGAPVGTFHPPWPAIAIATGRTTIPYLRALKREAGACTYTVALQDPRTGIGTADLIWVPEHDRLRGPNVIHTLTSPHMFSAARLAALRRSCPPEISALPVPRVAVLIGGSSKAFRFTSADEDRLVSSLDSLSRLGAGLMVTTSRRSPASLGAKLAQAVPGRATLLFQGEGPNPYPAFLANADVIVVTGDSVSMAGEAAATGKPILVFMPSGGTDKFRRFHEGLARYGAARPLPERLDALPSWTYAPLDAAALIAREIELRVARRSSLVAGFGPCNTAQERSGT